MPRNLETLGEAMERVKSQVDLRAFAGDHLTPMGKTFVCPACRSGEGPRRSPAFSIQSDGKRWKCFACDKGGDVFDLAGIVYGTDDRHEQLESVAAWAGVEGIDGSAHTRRKPDAQGLADVPSSAIGKPVDDNHNEGRQKTRGYLDECERRLVTFDGFANDFVWVDQEAGAYLEARGVDPCKAALAGFGYDPEAGGAKDGDGNWCRRGRVTMPWPVRLDDVGGRPWYYTSRSIDPSASTGKYHKPPDALVGGQPDVDATAMDANVLYVVEGLMDAWAVIFANDGGDGWPVPLGGVGNAQKVATQISDMGYAGIVVLMCDNDENGRKASEQMADIFTSKGVRWVEWPWKDGDHDPADSWRDTGGGFGVFADTVREWSSGHAESAYKERVRLKSSELLTDPSDVLVSLYDGSSALDPVKTGIGGLDDVLGGGLMPGSITVIGATSSSGKTTLSLQVANTIAMNGKPVLFVTIEQTPTELVAKSIAWTSSRLTGKKTGHDALTAISMRSRLERPRWTLEQNSAMVDACNWYSEHIAQRVRFMHGDERPTVAQMWNMAELMRAEFGEAPAIFIDYLQLLNCGDERDVRLATDENIRELRSMAQAMKTPVWVVSSVGRGAYYGTVDLGSYKESSGVEYGADVALGLQPRDMAEATESGRTEAMQRSAGKKRDAEEREKSMRNVEITVLKNRYGAVRPRNGVPLVYYCKVDRLIEVAPDR